MTLSGHLFDTPEPGARRAPETPRGTLPRTPPFSGTPCRHSPGRLFWLVGAFPTFEVIFNLTSESYFSSPRLFFTPSEPCPSFLVFLEFLVFSRCEEFLVFLSVFPFFSRDFWDSVGIKNPCFFWWFSGPFSKKQGKEGQGKDTVK